MLKENMFSKEQLIQSKKLKWNKDVIQAVLNEKQLYTKKEAERIIKMYLERKTERMK